MVEYKSLGKDFDAFMAMNFCQDIYQMLCRKYPNRDIYIIGDHHFYHKNILNYTRQNFTDISEMNEYIVKCHNETVGADDIAIFVGDFCFKNGAISEFLNRMNGHKYLILGNHDSKDLVGRYPSLGFEFVFLNPVKIGDLYLSHEPLFQGERSDLQFQFVLKEFQKCIGGINYHGHIHKEEKENPNNYRNVACEVLGYKPIKIGKTESLTKDRGHQLFINSDYFDDILMKIKEKRKVDHSIVVSDYIYSFLLEKFSPYEGQYFVHGSFGLFQKYNFLSKFSDLDISFIFDSSRSRKDNSKNFKRIIDASYESIKEMEKINLLFYKRYPSLLIYEILYTTSCSSLSKNYLDSNLIPLDCYRPTDFQKIEGKSIIENFVSKTSPSLLDEYTFPQFRSQSLIPEGDIANLILQLLFECEHEEKRKMVVRKLQYIYANAFKGRTMDNFLDIFTRFFLRNICFLHTMNRYGEIEYIQARRQVILDTLSYLPENLKEEFSKMFDDFLYVFLEIHKEVSSVPAKETFEKSLQIMNRIK